MKDYAKVMIEKKGLSSLQERINIGKYSRRLKYTELTCLPTNHSLSRSLFSEGKTA